VSVQALKVAVGKECGMDLWSSSTFARTVGTSKACRRRVLQRIVSVGLGVRCARLSCDVRCAIY